MSYPTYLCSGMSTTGDSATIDIQGGHQENTPPVLHVTITGSVNYTVWGSHDSTGGWQSYFTGTANAQRDFIIGVRFWKITVNTISGTITASTGPVPDHQGRPIMPRIVTPGDIPVI